jgi:L-lactate dehydrogenase (cytochrome)
VTLAANMADLASVRLRQRVLRDVSSLNLSTQLFGQTWALPVGLGPIGLSGMYARRGEVQAARAAGSAGVPFALSTLGVCPVREIARELRAPFWLQLYVIRDRGFVRDLLAQAKEARCGALLLTVDLPVSGSRYRDHRSGLSGGTRLQRALQAAARPGWAWDVGLLGRPHSLGNLEPVLGA